MTVISRIRPVAAGLPLLLAALAGCKTSGNSITINNQGGSGAGGNVKSETSTYTIPGAVRTISLEGRVGTLTVSAKDGPVSVTERSRYSDTKPLTSHEQNGDALQLREQSCPNRPPDAVCQVDWDVTAPAGTELELETGVGGVAVHGMSGRLTARAGTGDVSADGLASHQVSADSATGSTELAFTAVPDDVSGTADVGDVTITVPGDVAYAVRVNVGVGDKNVGVRQDPASEHRIRAKADVGDVEIKSR